jgi:tRNA-dihydrouridine synthase
MEQFQYMLAPMEGYSDAAFRRLCHNHGADLTFTEMTRVSAILRGNKSTISRLSGYGAPTVVQIFGCKEAELEAFLADFLPFDGFSGFNLNLGCSSEGILKLGLGAAMVKRVSKTARLVNIIKKHGYTASVKMRLGTNKYEKDKKAYINLIKSVDADYFIVHGRTAAETYANPSDFKVYAECVKTGKKIIANGDIDSMRKVNVLKKMGVSGVMIGRAALENPAIFEELKGMKVTGMDKLEEEYLVLAEQYETQDRYIRNVLRCFKGKAEFTK